MFGTSTIVACGGCCTPSGSRDQPDGGVKPCGTSTDEPPEPEEDDDPPAAAAPGAAAPNPPKLDTPLAVAVIDDAVTVPLDALAPCTTIVSPGWIADALLEALRVTFELSLVLTLIVVPSVVVR